MNVILYKIHKIRKMEILKVNKENDIYGDSLWKKLANILLFKWQSRRQIVKANRRLNI